MERKEYVMGLRKRGGAKGSQELGWNGTRSTNPREGSPRKD